MWRASPVRWTVTDGRTLLKLTFSSHSNSTGVIFTEVAYNCISMRLNSDNSTDTSTSTNEHISKISCFEPAKWVLLCRVHQVPQHVDLNGHKTDENTGDETICFYHIEDGVNFNDLQTGQQRSAMVTVINKLDALWIKIFKNLEYETIVVGCQRV